jgi:chromosome segregation ATPase
MATKIRSLEERARILQADSEFLRVGLAKQREEAQQSIDLKDKEISALRQQKAVLEQGMQSASGVIASLEESLSGLTDKDAIISNLKFQLVAQNERYSLAIGVIEKQRAEIESLEEKCVDLTTICHTWQREAESYRKQYELERTLRLAMKSEYGSCEFDRKASVVVGAGVGVYGLAKGDIVPAVAFIVAEGAKRLVRIF